MSRPVRLAIIALAAIAVGALPGILCALFGGLQQGAGVGIIGALIALGIAFSNIRYGTTRSAALRRIGKGLVCLFVAKNIHGGEGLFEFRDEVVPRGNVKVPREKLLSRMNRGMVLGACLGGTGALAAFGGWWASGGEPRGDQKFIAPILFMLGAIVGGCYGAALGMLTVRGWHRRNLALGAGVGLAIGVAIGLALGSQPTNASWLPHFFIAALFTTLGTGCGIIAPENFAGTPADEEPPPDDMERSRQRLRRLTSVPASSPPGAPSAEPRIDVRAKPAAARAAGASGLSGWSIFMMVASVFVLMIPLFAFTQQQVAEDRQRFEQQREVKKQVDQAILDGTAGPALRRLYGLQDDPPDKRPSATKTNAPAHGQKE